MAFNEATSGLLMLSTGDALAGSSGDEGGNRGDGEWKGDDGTENESKMRQRRSRRIADRQEAAASGAGRTRLQSRSSGVIDSNELIFRYYNDFENAGADTREFEVEAACGIPAFTVPYRTSWFKLDNVDKMEKRSLPEWFDAGNKDKSPQLYKDIRDYMIGTFLKDPSRHLTLTACRILIATDVCSLFRLHSFLQYWGLINYKVDKRTKPSTLKVIEAQQFELRVDTPTQPPSS